MSTASVSHTRFVRHDDGEKHPVMGDPMRFIVTAEQSGGMFALAEQKVRPGNGAPPHIHHHEDEAFYVMEGTFTVVADGKEYQLGAGDFINVSRGQVRSFTNAGSAEGRVLILHVPGSASGFYVEMGKLPFPPDMKDVIALGSRFGIEVVAPNA